MHMSPQELHLSPSGPTRFLFAGGHSGKSNFPMHTHDCWEVIYQRTGRVSTEQAGTIFDMSPGMILVHPPHTPHADWATEHYDIFFVHFEVHQIPHWPRLAFDDDRQSIGRACEDLCHEYNIRGDHHDRMIMALATRLDLLLHRAAVARQESPIDRAVTAARRLIEERYRGTVTVDALASEAGVSRSTLHAHFARIVGQSPIDYLQTIRLRHALGLLRHTTMTLETIADHCGFHSASHLSRHVKAATGSTPGALRKG